MNIKIKDLDVRDYIPYQLYDFNAKLYIGEKHVCDIENGPKKLGDIKFKNISSDGSTLIEIADIECRQLPPKPFMDENNVMHTTRMNIKNHIEDLIIAAHDPNKIERDRHTFRSMIEKALILGQPGDPIETFHQVRHPEIPLYFAIDREDDRAIDYMAILIYRIVRSREQEGINMKILNTNLSKEDIDLLEIAPFMAGKSMDELFPQKEKRRTFNILKNRIGK